jgi:MFS family permease
MNARIFFWSLTSALAGFLFGFDTVVISGAEKLCRPMGTERQPRGIAMASALYGTVVGSLVGGWPADRFGRKATLLWIESCIRWEQPGRRSLPMFGFSLPHVSLRARDRNLNRRGADVHFRNCTPRHRGRLAGMFQFNIVFGILIAFVSNALLSGKGKPLDDGCWESRHFPPAVRIALPGTSREPALAAQQEKRS